MGSEKGWALRKSMWEGKNMSFRERIRGLLLYESAVYIFLSTWGPSGLHCLAPCGVRELPSSAPG